MTRLHRCQEHDEQGVSVGVAALIACLLLVGIAVASGIVVVRSAHQTARRAADLGALAAAGSRQMGTADAEAAAAVDIAPTASVMPDPVTQVLDHALELLGCEEARRVVEANQARMVSCRRESSGVVVVEAAAPTSFQLPGVPKEMTARARASQT